MESILNAIGKTPLVPIRHLFKDSDVSVFAKCEFLNPGGSVKDRVGYRMVLDAQKSGIITPGVTTLIEPTSGNTGIGLALAGAVLGYRVIIVMPQKMSHEKQATLEALGAQIIRTPTEVASEDPRSHISVAKKIASQIPHAHILDQYANPSNWRVHYEETAGEIIHDLGRVPDVFVAAAGTGGTISGVAKRFKELNPQTRVIGVDPEGSILGGGQDTFSYQVEGIGYDFIPDVLNRDLVDEWVKTQDEDSFLWARNAMRQEGLLCGGSSGAALSGLNKCIKFLPPKSTVVVILADGIRNYMSKMLDNGWLAQHNFAGAILPTPCFFDDKEFVHGTS